MNTDTPTPSTPPSNEEENDAVELAGASAGFAFAGIARASIYGFLKKGLILQAKKKSFLRIGRLTQQSPPAAVSSNAIHANTAKSQKGWIARGLPAQLAKNTLLGISVFGTYEYLIHYYMNTFDCKGDGITSSVSPVVAHFGAGAIAGLMQSTVLTCWELASKLQSHHYQVPHNLRTRFVMRRAVHHSIGYASLFGTYEATRRLLLKMMQSQHDDDAYSFSLHETRPSNHARNGILLATSLVAGGIAGQVHQFVSYITSHWKLAVLQQSPSYSSDYSITKHARLPSLKSNLSAFVPTALCFVAFQYGEQVTSRLIDRYERGHHDGGD